MRIPARFTRDEPREARAHFGMAPPDGALVALEHRVYRVVDVRPVPVADWEPADEQRWQDLALGKPREEWQDRPHYVILREDDYATPRHLRIPTRRRWPVLPEHYSVCAVCHEVYPCRHLIAEQEGAAAAEQLERMESIMPGCCWACGEPITGRQKTVVFPGENLDLPGGPEVVFHTRQKCSGRAESYERRWLQHYPDQPWRLQCPGSVVFHVDGADCTQGEACPDPRVHHRASENHTFDMGGGRCTRCRDAYLRDIAARGPVDLALLDIDPFIALTRLARGIAARFDITHDEHGWRAEATVGDHEYTAARQPGPAAAADLLAELLLHGRKCRPCGQLIVVSGPSGCRWRREGAAWRPGCFNPRMEMW